MEEHYSDIVAFFAHAGFYIDEYHCLLLLLKP